MEKCPVIHRITITQIVQILRFNTLKFYSDIAIIHIRFNVISHYHFTTLNRLPNLKLYENKPQFIELSDNLKNSSLDDSNPLSTNSRFATSMHYSNFIIFNLYLILSHQFQQVNTYFHIGSNISHFNVLKSKVVLLCFRNLTACTPHLLKTV